MYHTWPGNQAGAELLDLYEFVCIRGINHQTDSGTD